MKEIAWSFGVGLVLSWALVLMLMYAPTGIMAVEVHTPRQIPPIHWVQPGESLWRIANLYWPGEHTGKRVHDLKTLNPDLGDILHPGDQIRLKKLRMAVD